MKYNVYFDNCRNVYESNSRNSKEHLKQHGGDRCTVTMKNGKTVSAAARFEDNSIHNVYFEH